MSSVYGVTALAWRLHRMLPAIGEHVRFAPGPEVPMCRSSLDSKRQGAEHRRFLCWPAAFALLTVTLTTILGIPASASAADSAVIAAATGGEPRAAPKVRISEVMTDPLLLDDVAGEFVEIVNVGTFAVRTAELELELPSGKRAVPLTDGATDLPPCGVLVLAPQPGPGVVMMKSMRLPNRAGRLALRWRGQPLDVVQWTGRWPWPKHKAGYALERRSADSDGTLGSSWRHARAPLRRVERGSPGRVAWTCDQADVTAPRQQRAQSRAALAPQTPPIVVRAGVQGTRNPRARSRSRNGGVRSAFTQRRAQSEWRLWEAMATLYSAATLSASGIATERSEEEGATSLR